MKYEYNKEFFISYTKVDKQLKLDLVSAVSILQDIVTEYFNKIGSDNIVTKNENEAIWVVTKTKMHFNKYPVWRDIIIGNTYTTKVTPIRSEVETQFKNKESEILFSAKQESCPIDLNNRKIRKISTINYPQDMETKEQNLTQEYYKLNEEFTENDIAYKQIVYSSEIDYSGHTNNVFYIRYILNALSCEFLDKCQITDLEIHYINETREKQELKIYKKIKENTIDFLIKESERDIIRAKIDYIKLDKEKQYYNVK